MQTSAALREAEEFLHREIPLTRSMAARVVPHESSFAIEASVASNRNHLGTGFGGSINSIATLAGYVFLWLQLRNEPAELVISESAIRFLQPVRETIRAICSTPAAEQLAAFHETLRATGRARLALAVRVEENDNTCAEFTATFVATTAPAAAPEGAAH